MFTYAVTRTPGKDFANGITTSTLGLPDYLLMLAQHAQYVDILRSLGLIVQVLEPLPGFPDAYFVEDAAVVFPEAAVITRPGALARRGEEDSIQTALEQECSGTTGHKTYRIQAPGTLEGGDVLMLKKHFFIGISERTNREGAEQLGRIVQHYGYSWTTIPVERGLHLKSDVNTLGDNLLLVTARFAHHPGLEGYPKLVVEAGDEYSANTLRVNNCLLTPQGFPATRAKLKTLGLQMIEVDMSEARKMDGGLTCMSLRF